MAKTKIKYICQECGYESLQWSGRCTACGAWNSFAEEKSAVVKTQFVKTTTNNQVCSIKDVKTDTYQRTQTAIAEFDRVLGGGFVPGSVSLIGGDPGIGKSTLALQIAQALAVKKQKVLYISGEESLEQLKLRGERLKTLDEDIYLFSAINVQEIENQVKKVNPSLLIVDSIQTVYHPEMVSSPGSVGQVREAANFLIRVAKEKNIALLLLGHVTKEGMLAGPKVLEHMVDTVLYFEGERAQNYRILRSIKNRFGSTNEIGIFEMRQEGLCEVKNPSEIFLQNDTLNIPGAMIVPVLEGTRSFLVEVQSLVSPSTLSMPRRTFTGIDANRAAIIIAVLEKKCGLVLGHSDVFINVVGGVQVEEPGADLGIALAIASSFKEIGFNRKIAAIGEIGLGSELRSVSNIEKRLNEAGKLGFKACVIPAVDVQNLQKKFQDLELIAAHTLPEALAKLF